MCEEWLCEILTKEWGGFSVREWGIWGCIVLYLVTDVVWKGKVERKVKELEGK